MTPIHLPHPSPLPAEKVVLTIATQLSPEIESSDAFASLIELTGRPVPWEVRRFFANTTVGYGAVLADVISTRSNYALVELREEFHASPAEIEQRYRELCATETLGTDGPIDRWPRHWLPVHRDCIGDVYAIALEERRSPVVCFNNVDGTAEYEAESIQYYANMYRARMAVEIYSRLSSMELAGRRSLLEALKPDGRL